MTINQTYFSTFLQIFESLTSPVPSKSLVLSVPLPSSNGLAFARALMPVGWDGITTSTEREGPLDYENVRVLSNDMHDELYSLTGAFGRL